LARQRGVPAPQPADEVMDFLPAFRYGRVILHVRTRSQGDAPRPSASFPRLFLTPSYAQYAPSLADNAPGQVTADRPEDLQRRVHFIWPGKVLVPADPLSYCRGILLPDALAQLAHA